ncbi:MAG: hypothetical protein WC440_03735 [Candidatus Omnitrophota bacterium]
MTREKDFQNFLVLLSTIAVGTPQRDKIDEDVIESYYVLLEDMPFETIKTNVVTAVRKNGWFPMINEIRGEDKTNRQAMEDYEYLSHLLDVFYQPELGRSSMAVIENKLERSGKGYLVGFLNRHGTEIVFGENPTATRAQLIKQLDVEIERHVDEMKQIGKADQKQISEMSDGGHNYPDLSEVLAKIGKAV